MAIATVLHWDRFTHGHWAFWGWAFLYAVVPVLLPSLWFRNRATDSGPRGSEVPLPAWSRTVMYALGAAFFAGGLAVFLAPSTAIAIWPWELKPLTARVIGGWLMLPGAGLTLMARDGRWVAARVLIEAALVWDVLLVAGTIWVRDDLDFGNPLAWAYIGILVAGGALLVAQLARMRVPGRLGEPGAGVL
jgi:hypothetical protein